MDHCAPDAGKVAAEPSEVSVGQQYDGMPGSFVTAVDQRRIDNHGDRAYISCGFRPLHKHLMIASTEALRTLDRMLADAGFDRERPDPRVVLRVFREFAQVPVACAEDLFLFQTGTYDFTGPELFAVDFTRQFSHENEDGEYAGMEQLHCVIYYEPTDELRALTRNLWSSACDSVADFFARIVEMPEYRVPVERYTPLRAETDQEDV